MLVEYYNCFIKKLKTIVNIVYERTQMIINTSFQLDLNLKQEEGDVTSFITNGEWDLISMLPSDINDFQCTKIIVFLQFLEIF